MEKIAQKYEQQGFIVIREPTFRGACGDGRCRPDLLIADKNGRILKGVEVKGGNGQLSARQNEIFPDIESGNAYPRGRWIEDFHLNPNLPLKNQGYPNGIPVEAAILIMGLVGLLGWSVS